MKLKEIRVCNYKCVLDSEWFTVDDLTALVGKNESGKTTILEAIEHLNSVDLTQSSFQRTDYPRMFAEDLEDSAASPVAVESKWALDQEEVDYINGLSGVDVLRSTEIVLSKNYDNKFVWNVDLDYDAAVKDLLANSGLTDADKDDLGNVASVAQLFKALKGIDPATDRQSAFLAELTTRFPTESLLSTITRYLKDHIPNFVYYSNYDRLPGRVSIDDLLARKTSDTLDQIEGSKVFISLLSMVGTTPEQLKSISTSEDLISKLESVQSSISRRIFKYWSQNKHLKVRFLFGEASPGDQPPFNAGKVFQTRIENTRHEATINLSERSTGFIWLFSFLVWFSEVQKEFGDNLVVLLDEPGLSLHGRAQFDLLRFIKAELLSKYQVIYTTHSPFMIDPQNLLLCRTVEDVIGRDNDVLGTKVGDNVLSTDSDTVFPLQAALGYDITQTIFVGEHTLLVEGPSDLLYLQWASSELESQGKTGLDKRWNITPCGSLSKVSSFLALFGGNKLHIAVLTDYGQGDKTKVRELRESELLRAGHVFTADMFVPDSTEADMEDILGRAFYVGLISHAYGLKTANHVPKTKPSGAGQRIPDEVKTHFDTMPANIPNYDHYFPAKYLIQHSSDLDLDGKAEALDRFEESFKELNALL